MVAIRIYIEGGGDTRQQQSALRAGFASFFEKAGLKGQMPKIIGCGGRISAYDDFRHALASHQNDTCILLVDSEEKFPENVNKWEFLRQRRGDKWARPANTTEKHVYLMVQCMEAWLVADKDALEKYYKNNFKPNLLPNGIPKDIDKKSLYRSLEAATKDTTKKAYNKGNHSFELIGLIDPKKIMNACPSAKALIDYLHTIS